MSTNSIPKLLLTLSASLVVIAAGCGGEDEPSARAAAPGPVDRAALHGAPPGVQLPKLVGPKQYDEPPPMLIDPSKKYTAHIELEKGKEIVVELFADKAPKTVNNFVFLARDGFYDRLDFYRVILLESARAGDPTGTGTGGPGYYVEDEFHPDLYHKFTVVTMDNDGNPDTVSSRFMIITVGSVGNAGVESRETSATEHMNGFNLDGSPRDCADPEVSCHSVFGVVAGGDVSPTGMGRVILLKPRDPATATTPGDVIKTIRIEESE